MKRCISLFLMVCCFGVGKNSSAQATLRDTVSQSNSYKNAVKLYNASLSNHSPLFNGPEYYFYDPLIKGNAYFLDINAFTPGSIFYDGALYTGVPMLYDVFKDEVVVLLYNHFSKFSLLTEKVKSFDYLERHFVNIKADTLAANTPIQPGFYDELYNKKLQVLVKVSKNLQNHTNGIGIPEAFFNLKKEFYIKKNSIYYSISGKRSFINILKDRRKDIQQYIRTNKINYREDPEAAMVKIAAYYDSLTN